MLWQYCTTVMVKKHVWIKLNLIDKTGENFLKSQKSQNEIIEHSQERDVDIVGV